MALFNQEILRGGGTRDYHRLRMCVKLHIDQAQRSKKFRIQSEITERVAATEGKGQNSFIKRKTGECFQWKADGSCSKGDSCSFLHSYDSGNRETSADGAKNTGVSSLKSAVDNERRRKGKGQASSSVPKVKEQTDVKSSNSPETSPATRAKIPCSWGQDEKRSSCDYRHHPVCRNYKSGNRCICGHRCLLRHAHGERKASARSRKECTQGVALLREKRSKVVYLKIQSQRSKSILRKAGQTRLNASAGHAINFSGRTWYEVQIRKRKGQSGGIIQKGEPHEANPCASSFEERTSEETSQQEDLCQQSSVKSGEKNIQAQSRR